MNLFMASEAIQEQHSRQLVEFLRFIRPSQLVDVIEALTEKPDSNATVVIGNTIYTVKCGDLPALFNRLRYFMKTQLT